MDNSEEPSQETKERSRKDPKNWIWGIFYFNKEDKRLLPTKRIALMGWTVNFANRNSVLLFTVVLLLSLLVYIVDAKK